MINKTHRGKKSQTQRIKEMSNNNWKDSELSNCIKRLSKKGKHKRHKVDLTEATCVSSDEGLSNQGLQGDKINRRKGHRAEKKGRKRPPLFENNVILKSSSSGEPDQIFPLFRQEYLLVDSKEFWDRNLPESAKDDDCPSEPEQIAYGVRRLDTALFSGLQEFAQDKSIVKNLCKYNPFLSLPQSTLDSSS